MPQSTQSQTVVWQTSSLDNCGLIKIIAIKTYCQFVISFNQSELEAYREFYSNSSKVTKNVNNAVYSIVTKCKIVKQ